MSETETRSQFRDNGRKEITAALTILLADVFAIYVKTKNFHWHMSGLHFPDYHLFLDEHARQIFAMIGAIAERARKLGGITLHSIGQLQRILDHDSDCVAPDEMFSELREDNFLLAGAMQEVLHLCQANNDVTTSSLLRNWIGEAERRGWFLFEVTFRDVHTV